MTIAYGLIADCLRTRVLVPFLGAAASRVGATGGDPLPTGAELAKYLANRAYYPGTGADPLTKVSQFIEEVAGDRRLLLQYVYDMFGGRVTSQYTSAATRFLGNLPPTIFPDLIITTNYDVTTELVLENRSLPYIAISHIFGNSKYSGRLLCYESLSSEPTVRTATAVNEYLLTMEREARPPRILYKMHGSARLKDLAEDLDTVVLTENDYIRFLSHDALRTVPALIQRKLTESRLLYLGYSLEDWNFRVLLNRIRDFQSGIGRRFVGTRVAERRHWACVLSPDDVEQRFWHERGVTLYAEDLAVFLAELEVELAK